ncbi:MAG TPA: SgcJ/EcaC family oxidoreductase, partial [Gemmataceae bacterium]|nr:SgcJ/EcaC family oxidoreductase [Gemmataceae bacterium]
MFGKPFRFLAGGVIAALAIGVLSARDDPKPAVEPGREADAEAIRASARDFAAAFNKHDAKTVAAEWTEQGECVDADGELVRGRADIETAFAEFFKENPNAKIQVLVKSIRFPAPDLAVEDGLLRQINTVKDLPATTFYSATHVRTGGKWLTATSREWGAGQDRLDDIEWLVGDWKTSAKGASVTLTFSRDSDQPFILGKFTRKDGGKPHSTGTMRIGVDPKTGQLLSWHFDEDGGHGQAAWARDGNRWVLDAVGVTGTGIETASTNVLGRLNNDEITWQSIDRMLGDQPLP